MNTHTHTHVHIYTRAHTQQRLDRTHSNWGGYGAFIVNEKVQKHALNTHTHKHKHTHTHTHTYTHTY